MALFVAVLQSLRLGEAALLCVSSLLQARLLFLPNGGAKLQLSLLAVSATSSRHARGGGESRPQRGVVNNRRAVALLARVARTPALALASRLVGSAVMHPSLRVGVAALLGGTLLFEGGRWQLVPLFISSAATAAAEPLLSRAPAVVRGAAAVASLALTSASAFASLVFPFFSLPPPSGPHAVGRITRVVTDPSRGAWVTPEYGPTRRLMVELWFPAVPSARSPRSRYMSPALSTALSSAFLGPRYGFVASHFGAVSTASRVGAAPLPPPPGSRGWPLLLFSHGNVSTRLQNTGLMEDLASHGWVCVACDHPFDAACIVFEGGDTLVAPWDAPGPLDAAGVLHFRQDQVALRAGDLAFLRAQLGAAASDESHPMFNYADVERAAVCGHSFGGAAAAAAAEAGGWRAAVLLDAWQWPLGGGSGGGAGDGGEARPLPCPLLLFESSSFLADRDAFCAFNGRLSSRLALAHAAAGGAPAFKLVAHHTGHYEYTDSACCECLLSPLLTHGVAVAVTAPRFLRAAGLLALRPGQLAGFSRYQHSLVRSFLEAHVGASPGEGGDPLWSPPRGPWATPVAHDALSRDAAPGVFTRRQRAAMALLLKSIRQGHYAIWGVLPTHTLRQLQGPLCAVIHSYASTDIERLLEELEAEAQAVGGHVVAV